MNYVALIYDERCQTGRDVRQKKMDGVFHPHTSVIWDIVSREIRVSTDGGRLIRPFYKLGEDGSVPEVKEGAQWHEPSPTVRWSTLTSEAAFTLIAFARKNITGKDRLYGDPSEFGSGCAGELHPVSGSQPVPPKQLPIGGKQAVGLHTRFFRHRMDTGIHVMDYGQRPSRAAKWQT
jgi:hypothetical protein